MKRLLFDFISFSLQKNTKCVLNICFVRSLVGHCCYLLVVVLLLFFFIVIGIIGEED